MKRRDVLNRVGTGVAVALGASGIVGAEQNGKTVVEKIEPEQAALDEAGTLIRITDDGPQRVEVGDVEPDDGEDLFRVDDEMLDEADPEDLFRQDHHCDFTCGPCETKYCHCKAWCEGGCCWPVAGCSEKPNCDGGGVTSN